MSSTKQMIITLIVVAVVCSIILSFVYSYTQPRIEETKKAMTLAGLKEVIDAQEFVEVLPDTLWRALDSAGKAIGIVFRVFPQGYGGPIPITIGLDTDGIITGVRIASAAEGLKETPGLGAKITEVSFTDQFNGKCAAAIQIKKDGGEIDAITAATISSRAVCNGIKTGIETYQNYLKEPVNKKCVFPEANNFIEIIKDTLWYAVRDAETLGIVFIGTVQGYADIIKFIVGFDNDQAITGVKLLYSNETAGCGDRINETAFLDQFKEGKPETISGATISSEALIKGVEAGIERFKEYLK